MELSLNDLKNSAFQNAKAHGFHQGNESIKHYLCLIVTELAEAVEADRKGDRADIFLFYEKKDVETANQIEYWQRIFETYIKDTLEDELADSVIRILDLSGLKGIELDVKSSAYVREYMDKMEGDGWNFMDFTEKIWNVIEILTHNPIDVSLPRAIAYITCICVDMDIDIMEYVSLKMEYNKNRTFKHGKSY